MTGKTSNVAGDIVNFIGSGSATITSSANTLNPTAKGLYVESGGTLELEFADGTTDTWTVPDNFLVPMNVTKFTGGTATGVHAIY